MLTASSGLHPSDLRFTVQARYRPFDLIAPNFVQHAAQPGATRGMVRAPAGPRAPFATVLLDVADPGEGVAAGLVAEGANAVLVRYDPARRCVSIEVTREGTAAVAARARVTRKVARATRFGFAFALNGNAVVALADTGSGWRPLLRSRITALVDLRRPEALSAYRYGYGAPHGGGAVLEAARAGYFGQTGLRDPHLVTYADGTPYIRDGKAYVTFTQAGLGFFEAAHWGVWTLDLADPGRLEQVAQVFFERHGLVLGDHAGHIVYDDRDGVFIVAVSGWGDFPADGVRVHYARVREDVLSGVHVLRTRPMPLPTEASCWDPAIARIDDRWHVAFVESPSQSPFRFHPAVAHGRPGGDVDDLMLAGRDAAAAQTEGTIVAKIGGTWYLLASDGAARCYRVYDLRARPLGVLGAPYGTNIPHPMVVPVPDQRRTRYLMVTFDGVQYAKRQLGYGTHGDVLVMTAPQTLPGQEFPPRTA
ncbi:MAG: hypothetical protein ACRDPK_08900 [Carbonactinosporaceae bacterium]